MMIRGIVLAIVIASVGTACHAQNERIESEPTFQSIADNLDDFIAAYPRTKSGEANSCAEIKIVSYQKLRDKQLTVRDLTSSQPALKVNEWVYFEGAASGFDRRSELFDLSNAKGTLGVAGVDHEAVILIVPDTEIWFRIGKKELLLDDSAESFASKRGASVCGYGLVVERAGNKYIAIADVIRNNNDNRSAKVNLPAAQVAVEQPTKCEIIFEGRDKASKDCSAGQFSACQEIAGWTREVMMEGCTSSTADDSNTSSDESAEQVSRESQSDECASLAETSLLTNGYCMDGSRKDCEYLETLAKEAVEKGCTAEDVKAVVASNNSEEGARGIGNATRLDAELENDVAMSSENSSEEAKSNMAEAASGPFSPSFRCYAGSLPSEATICGNRSLAALDRELAGAYRSALQRMNEPQHDVKRSYITSMQRQWLNERNKQCGADAACLEDLMKSRIQELEAN